MTDPKPRAMVPRAVTPRVATPRAITPRAITPRAITPRAITPRAITPRAITPRVVPPRFPKSRGPRRFERRRTRGPERPTLSRLIAGLVLCVLAGLPVLALVKVSQHVPGFWLLGYCVVVSLLAFLFCASDKRQAKDGQWRTPENLLHFLELIGGWPGSFVAQHQFRHKVKKGSYQFAFWLIVAGYQLVAFDYLADWRLSLGVRDYVAWGFREWSTER